MANTNLAQHEQILKSLERSLKEICDYHKVVHDSLTELQTHYHLAQGNADTAWAEVIKLFVKIDQLRSTHHELDKNKQ